MVVATHKTEILGTINNTN